LSEFIAGLLMSQLQLTAPVDEFVSVHDAELKVTRVGSGVTEIVMSDLGVSTLSGLVGVSLHAAATTASIATARHFRVGIIEAP
jgi:hypothetical protein